MADDASLVEVRKDAESLHVHPTTVAAHVAAGWRVAAVKAAVDREIEPDEPKAAGKPRRP